MASKQGEAVVSIIMPSYNAGAYIYKAINSVLNQSYSNWELLIIDDGSTDNTHKIVSEFNDHRIRNFLIPDNQGVSNARNVGLKHIQGEYFTFLDADDEMPENSLFARLKIFLEYPEVTFVDGIVISYDATMQRPLGNWTPSYKGDPRNELIGLNGSCFFGLTWMIKRVADQGISFKTGMTHGEDLLYFVQLCQHRDLIYSFTDQEILHRRTGHQSAMSNLDGLEQGYYELYRFIKGIAYFSSSQVHMFKRKAKLIMFKSYLQKMRLFSAIKVIAANW